MSIPRVLVLVPALAGICGMAAPIATAGPGSMPGAPSRVSVLVTPSACEVTPASVPEGAVRFTIRNRSRVPQRFTLDARTSARVAPRGQFAFQVGLDKPGVVPYKCTPTAGSVRGGYLRVTRNVVVETDMDASDTMAILYLLHRHDVNVAAIVVDGDGEARCPAGATNAHSITALAGKTDIPVGCGRPQPLQGGHAFPTAWRDFVDNFFGMPRPDAPADRDTGTGEQVLRAAIQSAPGRVDVLTLGPPTELAAVLSADATLRNRIGSVTMMGGAVGVPGNITWPPGVGNQYAEWNFYVDPHAANIVFHAGVPITLVALDATSSVPLNASVAARLGNSASAVFVRQLIESLLPSTTLFFWDPLAAAVLVDQAVAGYADKQLAVVDAEGPESGRVIETAQGSKIHVAVSANRARFETSFASTLR